LDTLLRALIKSNFKALDLLLLHAVFVYSKALSKITRISPFKVVYGVRRSCAKSHELEANCGGNQESRGNPKA